MKLPRTVKHGISTIAALGIIVFFITTGFFAFTFSGVLTFNNASITSSQQGNISTLGEALNDLKKNGFKVVESDTLPAYYSEIKYADTYSEFIKKATPNDTILFSVNNDKCVLAVEKNNSLLLWLPAKWTKLKIINYQCESQTPGWKITIQLQNIGNVPTTIDKIIVDSGEIAKNNYETNDYVPLSASTSIKTNTIIDVGETEEFIIRISNYYKFIKSNLVELKIINSYGIETKVLINLK